MTRKAITVFIVVFSAFMVIGRLISGVHWATDIAGSVFLSYGLFMIYRYKADYFVSEKVTLRAEESDAVHFISDCVTSYDLKNMPEMLACYTDKGCEVKNLAIYIYENEISIQEIGQ